LLAGGTFEASGLPLKRHYGFEIRMLFGEAMSTRAYDLRLKFDWKKSRNGLLP
jgi:hypothetical protein